MHKTEFKRVARHA